MNSLMSASSTVATRYGWIPRGVRYSLLTDNGHKGEVWDKTLSQKRRGMAVGYYLWDQSDQREGLQNPQQLVQIGQTYEQKICCSLHGAGLPATDA